MRRSSVAMWTSAILFAGCAEATWAQATALTVSGSPAPFLLSTAVPGSQPAAISNNITSYFVKARASAGPQKITAQLDRPMPAGTMLTIQLAPSAGATTLGAVSLDGTPRNVEINIAKDKGTRHGITYVFTASVAAGVVPSQTRTVTLTMSSYP